MCCNAELQTLCEALLAWCMGQKHWSSKGLQKTGVPDQVLSLRYAGVPVAAAIGLPPGQTTAQREHDLRGRGMDDYWAELEVACHTWCGPA